MGTFNNFLSLLIYVLKSFIRIYKYIGWGKISVVSCFNVRNLNHCSLINLYYSTSYDICYRG